MKSEIYILTNNINQKQYIGQTLRGIDKRITEHKKGKTIISKALNKYGLDNFKIIHFQCPEEDLDWQETFLIEELNTLVPNGYNLETGGNKNKKLNEITKQKISEKTIGRIPWNLGIPRTKEEKEKIKNRPYLKGKNHPLYKIPKTEEAKKKNSESHKGLLIGEKNGMWGKHHKIESKIKMSNKAKGRKKSDYFLEKMKKRMEGQNNPNCKLTKEKVLEIRNLINNKNLKDKDIIVKFNLTKYNFYSIKYYKSWRNI
jgi:group I intron endonuclease